MKEFKNNEWKGGQPSEGERVRVYDHAGGFAEITWHKEISKNKIIITSHDNRAIVNLGGSLTVTAEIRGGDNELIPITDSFSVPVGRVGGSNYRTLLMNFVDGVCSKTALWNDSGEFEITSEMINIHLDELDKLEFSGFNISVSE